eukprot:6200515-Pleurochrysis_carterae.AAC.1
MMRPIPDELRVTSGTNNRQQHISLGTYRIENALICYMTVYRHQRVLSRASQRCQEIAIYNLGFIWMDFKQPDYQCAVDASTISV